MSVILVIKLVVLVFSGIYLISRLIDNVCGVDDFVTC